MISAMAKIIGFIWVVLFVFFAWGYVKRDVIGAFFYAPLDSFGYVLILGMLASISMFIVFG